MLYCLSQINIFFFFFTGGLARNNFSEPRLLIQ